MAAAKLFIDASVFIAAAASPMGGSAAVLELGRRGHVQLFASRLVLVEVERNLRQKLPSSVLLRFYNQIGSMRIHLIKPTGKRELTAAQQIVAEKDAHVLAAAIRGHVDVLLTLDRKHLLTPAVRQASPIPIQTPGDFLQQFVAFSTD